MLDIIGHVATGGEKKNLGSMATAVGFPDSSAFISFLHRQILTELGTLRLCILGGEPAS